MRTTPSTRTQALVTGLIAALSFATLTMIHLDAQGAYYDELHQAPSAFHYVGKHPTMFTVMMYGRPWFNMTYSGAIKSGMYGLLLKYGGLHFTVYSWRLLGIALVAAGMLGFYAIAGSLIPAAGAVPFATLLITDVSAIVMTRHDWGPVALALALRLVFIGVWLSIELKRPAAYKYAVAGFIAGAAVFEKLSSVVLLVPFFILLLRARSRRAAWAAGLAGLLIGALPLIRGNIHSYRTSGIFISLTDIAEERSPVRLRDVARYAFEYVSLGQGEIVRQVG